MLKSALPPQLQSSRAFNSQEVEATDKIYRIPRGEKNWPPNPFRRQETYCCLRSPTADQLYLSFLFQERSCSRWTAQPLSWAFFLLVLMSDCPISAKIYIRGLLHGGAGKTVNVLSLMVISQLTRPPSTNDSLSQK